MTLDERLEALTMNLELALRAGEDQRLSIQEQTRNIQSLAALMAIDAENIRSLARIAEAHEHRLDQLGG